jgi:hypothetical protein
MELFEVMNLVLILHVAMVSGAEAEVGQPGASSDCLQPGVTGDSTGVLWIEKVKDLTDSSVFA